MRYVVRVSLFFVLLAVLGPVAPDVRAAEPAPSKRVLVLLPFETSRPLGAAMSQGIHQGLKSSYSGTVDILMENVGPVPPVPADFPARISDWLAYKYGNQKFDAIVTLTSGPIHLAESLRDRVWPGVPLLLVLIQEERQQNPVSVPRAARVVVALDNRETVRSALQMLPATQRLALIGGASEHDRQTNGEIVKAIREGAPGLEIIEITGLSWEETKARVSSLPAQTIALIGSVNFDRNGRAMNVPQVVDELSPTTDVPLFQDSDVAMGKGIVGGTVVSLLGTFVTVGEQLAQLLKGADPDILPVREVKNSFIVDWRQLQRWGISPLTLPPEATILYRPPTAWEQYGRYIVAFLWVLVLLLFLVAFLLLERQRRKKGEELNTAMLNSLPGLALLVNRQGKILRTNQVSGEADGPALARPGSSYGEYLRTLTGQHDSRSADHIDQVIAGSRGNATAETRLSADGRWIEVRALQLPKQNNGTLVVHLDITERKRAEIERLRSRTEIYHLNRVAAMGQLAASLAHELSQPLAAIMSNAEAAQRFAARPNPDMQEIREALDDITRDDKRARAVIQSMRVMLKKENMVVEPVDMNEVAASVVQIMRNEANLRGIAIEMDICPTAVVVKGDHVALQQVVLNLASNGLDAMMGTTAGQVLTLRTSIEPGATVGTIWVEDSGPGVSAEVRDKLFHPFFSTKESGLGMGLSICRSIIESLGGRIDIKDHAGRGAKFFVDLPLV